MYCHKHESGSIGQGAYLEEFRGNFLSGAKLHALNGFNLTCLAYLSNVR